MQATYAKIPTLIKNRETFKGSSVTATYKSSFLNSKKMLLYPLYIIKSYETVIAVMHKDKVIINITKYSRTTSKIQNILISIHPYATQVNNVPIAWESQDVLIEKLLEDM